MFQTEKKRLRFLYLLIFLFMVWAAVTIFKQELKLSEMRDTLSTLHQQENEVLKEQQELQLLTKKLDDENYIAQIARKYYYLSKENETIFVVPKK